MIRVIVVVLVVTGVARAEPHVAKAIVDTNNARLVIAPHWLDKAKTGKYILLDSAGVLGTMTRTASSSVTKDCAPRAELTLDKPAPRTPVDNEVVVVGPIAGKYDKARLMLIGDTMFRRKNAKLEELGSNLPDGVHAHYAVDLDGDGVGDLVLHARSRFTRESSPGEMEIENDHAVWSRNKGAWKLLTRCRFTTHQIDIE
jgi:hypothetical protein